MTTAIAPAARNKASHTKAARSARTGARSPATSAAVLNAERRITYDRIKAGVVSAEVERLVADGILATEDVYRVIPPRTLARRKARGEPLTVEESDRIARLVRVAAHAARVFDDPQLRSAWLRTGNPALGGEQPLAMAATDAGARRVETVLNRIAWGDYS